MKNATSPLFRNHNRSALEAGTYFTHRIIYYPLFFFFLYHNNKPVITKSVFKTNLSLHALCVKVTMVKEANKICKFNIT